MDHRSLRIPNVELALLRRRRYSRPPIVDLGPEAAQIKALVEWRIDCRCRLVLSFCVCQYSRCRDFAVDEKLLDLGPDIEARNRSGFRATNNLSIAIICDVYEGPLQIFFRWPIARNPDAAQNRVKDPGRGIFERDLTSGVALVLGPW